MSINDGKKLLVFGFSFAQHDSRHMQQILRHYSRLPNNPGSRAALFVELNSLAKELTGDQDEASQHQLHQLTHWITNGGDFPLGTAPAPVDAADIHQNASSRGPQPAYGQLSGRTSHYRYGQGRTLDGTAVVPSHSGEYGADQPDRDVDMHQVEDGDGDGDGDQELGYPAPEGQEMTDDRMTYDAQQVAQAGQFHGRGRTLNDAQESDPVTESTDGHAAPLPTETTPTRGGHTVIPQLRHNQGWQGGNVAGLGNIMPDMGHIVHGRAARVGMFEDEDGNEGMDEDEDENEDAWGAGQRPHRHRFGFGPGRTLNDPSPVVDQVDSRNMAIDSPIHTGDLDSANSDSDSEPDYRAVENQPISATNGESGVADQSEHDDDAEETECPICIGLYPPSSFPKRPTITELCDHPDKACLQCISTSITEIMKRGALHLLACPICPQKLRARDVKEFATKEVYERFNYLKQQSEIPGHWISCTNPSCGGSQPHNTMGPDGPLMVCDHCQFETCAKHRRPWHEGQSCAEYDMDPAQIERLEEEEATAKLLAQEDTSVCPKCGQGVTKTDGCDHMACQCGTEWCYVVSVFCLQLFSLPRVLEFPRRHTMLTVISVPVPGRTSSASVPPPTPRSASTTRTKSISPKLNKRKPGRASWV